MKKVLLLIGVLLLIQLVSANEFTFPNSIFSDSTYLGNNKMRTTYYSEPKNYFDGTELKRIDSTLKPSTNKAFDYMVIDGVYSVLIKNDGTYKFRNKGYSHSIKPLGFVLFNYSNKKIQYKIGLTLNSHSIKPLVQGNKISWQLPNGVNYFLEYRNSQFKDVMFISDSMKVYLKNLIQKDWNVQETLFGLVYDMNLNNSIIKGGTEIESNNAITFIDEQGKELHLIYSGLAKHEDWNKYADSFFDVTNEGFEWQRLRKYHEGKFFDLVPAKALFSSKGGIYLNATTTYSIEQSSDDADELVGGTVRTTGTTLWFSNQNPNRTTHMGFRFIGVDFNSDDNISEITLRLKGNRTCFAGAGACNSTIYGVNENNFSTWSALNKPSDANQTNNFVLFNFTSSSTPDGFDTYDKNVTTIVRDELFNAPTWDRNEQIAFKITKVSLGLGSSIRINAFDAGSNFPQLIFEHEGKVFTACDPEPDKNHFLNTRCYYKDQNIDLGSGSLFIGSKGFIGCDNSVYSVSNWIKCQSRDGFFYIADENISVSAEFIDKNAMSYDEGQNTNVSGSSWFAEYPCCTTNHWVEFDFNRLEYMASAMFAIDYENGWFTDVNAEYFNGLNWITLYDNANFVPSDCNELIAGTPAFCDLNVTINDYASKLRFSYNGNSGDNDYADSTDLNLMGINRQLIWGKPREQYCMEYANGGKFTVR